MSLHIFAHSLNATEEDLFNKAAYSSKNDFTMLVLINEGAPDDMSPYCERARDIDLLASLGLVFLIAAC